MKTISEQSRVAPNYESVTWKWMHYSSLLLLPLAWGHIFIQDILVGVHNIDLDYVAKRWATLGWRIYDFMLLAFAFAHGMNGLRGVLRDHIQGDRARRNVSWLLFTFWLAFSTVGAIAIIGGVRRP